MQEAGDRSRSRWWWLVALAALVVVAAGGWIAGQRVQSSDQAISRAAPPEASWITAPVERRILSQTLIARGEVQPQLSVEVYAPSSVVEQAVVTGLGVRTGDEAIEGTRLIEVSGRPVFVMAGEVPVYRPLRPGMSGADVLQLQEALTRLGYTPDVDGTFSQATKDAVVAFYESAGYRPQPTSDTVDIDLADAQMEVASTQSALDDATSALADLTDDVPSPDLVAASNELEAAQQALDDVARSSSTARAAARDRFELAEASLAAAESANDVEAATRARDNAQVARDGATGALWTLIATTGPTVAQGEIVFVPTLPARVQEVVDELGPASATNEADPAASRALVTLAVGSLIVTTAVGVNEVDLLRIDMPAVILDEQTGSEFGAAISSIATTGETGAEGEFGYPVALAPDDPLPAELVNANVRVTVLAASTESEVLVVPLAAVSSTADGATRVSVLNGADVDPMDVAVSAGISADGFVEVTASGSDALEAGDRVVVGR